jgi:hypothetical protein
MSTSIIRLFVGGLFAMSIATTAYGGTAQDHLPHNTHKPMTPEEQQLVVERRTPFQTRLENMKALIERAQTSIAVDERNELLAMHMKQMQYGLEKIEQMKHVRTNADIQRRIDMTRQLAEQMVEHQSEQKRMTECAMHIQMQEARKAIAKVADMRNIRTNAEINRKVGMMDQLMEQMEACQDEQKQDKENTVGIQGLSGSDRARIVSSRNQ